MIKEGPGKDPKAIDKDGSDQKVTFTEGSNLDDKMPAPSEKLGEIKESVKEEEQEAEKKEEVKEGGKEDEVKEEKKEEK